jgi:putative ABC transport system permease protein
MAKSWPRRSWQPERSRQDEERREQMFRSYLASAWRSARRDRLHTIINILGLAIGLAAAILIALYLRHELSYDNFLTGNDRVYRVSTQITIPGRAMSWYSGPPEHTAAALALDFPEFEGVARLTPDRIGVRNGNVESLELMFWADPAFLDVMGLKTIAGDAASALEAPDSVVLTRRMARKYFDNDTPLGATLEFGRKTPMRVTAVIEDLPSNTHLTSEIIASGRAAESEIADEDASEQKPGTNSFSGYVYVRLRPGVSAEALAPRLADFAVRHFPSGDSDHPNTSLFVFKLDPVTSVHLQPYSSDMKDRSDTTALAAIGLVGILIIAIASINFVNLMTARAARRAVEVGVRKALGATRRQLVVQFMAEAIGFAAFAAVIATALVEVALPSFNATLDRGIRFDYWQDPALALGILALVVVVGLGAGLYPALLLSSFSPAAVLKSARSAASGGGLLRQALVVLQFTVSIGLAVATLVIVRQTDFATHQSLRLNSDQVVLVRAPQACTDSFRNQVTALSGVRGAVCSRSAPLDFSTSSSTSTLPDGREVDVDRVGVDFGFFEFYGLPPLAGRLFDRNRAGDSVPASQDATMDASIVINEAAARAYGFAGPDAALDQEVTVGGVRTTSRPSRIIGVVPDFPVGTIRDAVQPSVFYVDPGEWGLLSVKLDGAQIPEMLAAIDRIWAAGVVEAPIRRLFLDHEIEQLYRDIERQGRVFGGFAAVAIAIGCLGLFGLSAFAAERRTKEIGIRKALGASTLDVARLLIWQFTKPVLLANAIAWPLAWWLMRGWLDGFAYRIELSWVPFVIAGGGAVVIAVATTGFHALQVAKSRPVTALRYE